MGKKTRNAKKAGGILAGHESSSSSSPASSSSNGAGRRRRSVTPPLSPPPLSPEKKKSGPEGGEDDGSNGRKENGVVEMQAAAAASAAANATDPPAPTALSAPIKAVALSKSESKRRITREKRAAERKKASERPPPPPPPSLHRKFLSGLLRLSLLDLPLLFIFALSSSSSLLRTIHDDYLVPQMEMMEWTPEEDWEEGSDGRNPVEEYTYYNRHCVPEDVSATDADELLVHENMTARERSDRMMIHGASMYPGVLTRRTASAVRDFVLRRNAALEEGDGIDVISNENRWSFGIGATEHSSISRALHEIASHPILRPSLEILAGTNPAIIEMTAITSAYGASDQFWHEDTLPKGNSLRYGRAFLPSFSLFVTLQDTSRSMGATEVCPGTHVCGDGGAEDFCPDLGFPASGRKAGRFGTWKAGSALLMNQQTYHRGAAHTDRDGPHRVLFILTFAPRPTIAGAGTEYRMLPQGGSYSTRWDMWGHTLDDVGDATAYMGRPFFLPALRALGLYNPPPSPEWGWDFVTVTSMRIANGDVGYNDGDDLETFVKERGGVAGAAIKHARKTMGLPISRERAERATATMQMALEENFDPNGSGWREYADAVVKRADELLDSAHRYFLGIYAVLSILPLLVSFLRRRRRSAGKFIAGSFGVAFRVAVIHALVYSLAELAEDRVRSSPWARGIVSSQSSNRPYSPAFSYSPEGMEVGSGTPHPPTVPRRSDVLLGSRLDSAPLASAGRAFLDHHPGNVAWGEILESYDSGGAPDSLLARAPPSVRRAAARSALEDLTRGGRRILLQDADTGYWTVPPLSVGRELTLEALSIRGDERLRALDAALRRMTDECRTGRGRGTAMVERVGLYGLEKWREAIFKEEEEEGGGGSTVPIIVGGAPKNPILIVGSTGGVTPPLGYPFVPRGAASIVARREARIAVSLSDRCVSHTRGLDLSQRKRDAKEAERKFDACEDFETWPPRVGDMVEGQYQAKHNEWYKGKIKAAHPTGLYDVLYDDGDLDPDLPPGALRPYEPLRKDEVIAVQIPEDDDGRDFFWEDGVIRDVLPPATRGEETLYNVVTSQGYFEADVPAVRIRRYQWGMNVGDRIMAKFRGLEESEWSPGRIVKVRRNGYYDVDYDDGDRDVRIKGEFIRFGWSLAGEVDD